MIASKVCLKKRCFCQFLGDTGHLRERVGFSVAVEVIAGKNDHVACIIASTIELGAVSSVGGVQGGHGNGGGFWRTRRRIRRFDGFETG